MGIWKLGIILVLAAQSVAANDCKNSTEWSQEVREATRLTCARLFSPEAEALEEADFHQTFHNCEEARDAFDNSIRDMGRTCRGPTEASFPLKRYLQLLDDKLNQHQARINQQLVPPQARPAMRMSLKSLPQNVGGLKNESK